MVERETATTYWLIWDVVRQIPRGRVATYGEVAREAGYPGQARLVGYALHSLPRHSNVPWHRVVNSQGRISLPRTGGAHRLQRGLLQGEGVAFVRGKINLKKFGWLSSDKTVG